MLLIMNPLSCVKVCLFSIGGTFLKMHFCTNQTSCSPFTLHSPSYFPRSPHMNLGHEHLHGPQPLCSSTVAGIVHFGFISVSGDLSFLRLARFQLWIVRRHQCENLFVSTSGLRSPAGASPHFHHVMAEQICTPLPRLPRLQDK